MFKFGALGGAHLTVEVMSLDLTDSRNPWNPVDGFDLSVVQGNTVVASVAPNSSNVNAGEFDGMPDQDTEVRTLLYDFVLPGSGFDTWGIYIDGVAIPFTPPDDFPADGDGNAVGQYEMLVIIPEPASLMLLGLGTATLLRRRARPHVA